MLLHFETPLTLTPWATAGAVRFLVSPLARAMRDATAGSTSAVGWQELVNKTDVITAVEGAARDGSLTDLLQGAALSDAFIRLWVLEGTGRRFMDRLLQQDRARAFSRAIPGSASSGERAMLHAGMGMALGIACLADLPSCGCGSGLRTGLRDFVASCRSYSQCGYAGAALESLGLVTRFLRPDLVSAIDRVLCQSEPDTLAYFWHGAGRAIYFLPSNLAQAVTGRRDDVLSAKAEPPHAVGHANALVGWAWAVALVNLHHPPVIEAAFCDCQPADSALLAYAVWSAVSIRRAVDRTDRSVTALLQYQPRHSNAAFASFWDLTVRRPAARALRIRVDDVERLYRIDVPHAMKARCA